jgi:hypothetical protein
MNPDTNEILYKRHVGRSNSHSVTVSQSDRPALTVGVRFNADCPSQCGDSLIATVIKSFYRMYWGGRRLGGSDHPHNTPKPGDWGPGQWGFKGKCKGKRQHLRRIHLLLGDDRRILEARSGLEWKISK